MDFCAKEQAVFTLENKQNVEECEERRCDQDKG